MRMRSDEREECRKTGANYTSKIKHTGRVLCKSVPVHSFLGEFVGPEPVLLTARIVLH